MIFRPFNLRFLTVLKYHNFQLQRDGSFRSARDLVTWQASWAVNARALRMLETTNSTGRSIPVASSSMPEVWHLASQAEDRCRTEHLNKLRRDVLSVKGADRRQPNLGSLWGEPFRAAARDTEYWSKHVTNLALLFIARFNSEGFQNGCQTLRMRL
eukprot:6010468-Amphidinium_carterae.2